MSDFAAALSGELVRQRDFVRDREPSYAILLELLSEALPGDLAQQLEHVWSGRAFFAWYDRPLLLLGSLRYDALSEGPSHPLWPWIGRGAERGSAPASRFPSAAELGAALDPGRGRFWDALARRTVQTNETTRAVAWLWPAALIASVDAKTPLHLVDIGCSAGLNLIADQLPAHWTDQGDRLLPVAPLPHVAIRLGLDRSPLDVRDPDAALWLEACVWPSDHERQRRLAEGVAAFRSATRRAQGAPGLEACEIEGVPARLAAVGGEVRLLALQTVVRDYLSPQQRSGYELGMGQVLLSRGSGRALWGELETEPEGQPPPKSAVLRVHMVGPAGELERRVLARTHPHPRQLFVDREAVEGLLAALRG